MAKDMTKDNIFNVLFLCTGNSCRSIMAECILNRVGQGRFTAWSAGSTPTGQVNPHALNLLKKLNYPTADLRSKSWDEFAAAGAPELDFVFTLCDDAAGEVCPVWPGQPMTAHWGFPDPARFEGSDAEKATEFGRVYKAMENLLSTFCSLPLARLDRLTLQKRLEGMGRAEASAA